MPHTPHGGAVGAPGRGRSRSQSLGAVLGALRTEFPEVTLSRIRYLEAEGLVRPERSRSGRRMFRETDVERLRRVLGMQRDHCLPLRAIRERLDAGPGDGRPPVRQAAPPAPPRERTVRAGRNALLEATGAGEGDCAEWEAYGLVGADSRGAYGTDQVEVARMIAELGRHGLEPRHLRGVKAAADRSACRVREIVAPLRSQRDPRAREQADATAAELVHLTARLHDAFLRSALDAER